MEGVCIYCTEAYEHTHAHIHNIKIDTHRYAHIYLIHIYVNGLLCILLCKGGTPSGVLNCLNSAPLFYFVEVARNQRKIWQWGDKWFWFRSKKQNFAAFKLSVTGKGAESTLIQKLSRVAARASRIFPFAAVTRYSRVPVSHRFQEKMCGSTSSTEASSELQGLLRTFGLSAEATTTIHLWGCTQGPSYICKPKKHRPSSSNCLDELAKRQISKRNPFCGSLAAH